VGTGSSTIARPQRYPDRSTVDAKGARESHRLIGAKTTAGRDRFDDVAFTPGGAAAGDRGRVHAATGDELEQRLHVAAQRLVVLAGLTQERVARARVARQRLVIDARNLLPALDRR